MSKKKKRSFNKVSAPGENGIKTKVRESADNGFDESRDKGLTKGSVAMGVGLVAGTALILAMGQSTKKGVNEVIEDKQNVEIVDGKPEVKSTPRNLEKYMPPGGCEITKKKFIPGADKTIIFVPEVHKASTGAGKQNGPMESMVNKIHLQKFEAVADLVRKFGKTPIVLEAWNKEDTGADILDNANFKTEMFNRLRNGGPIEARLEMGRRLVAGSGVPAYVVLLAIFGKDLSPVGVLSANEQDKTDETVEFAREYYDLVQSDKPICNTGEGGFVSFEGMLDQIGRGNKESVMHCFCAVEQLKYKMEDVIEEREDVASVNEVKVALDLSDNLVIVSTGQLHNEKATGYLDSVKTANYMVILPVALKRFKDISESSDFERGDDSGFEAECKALESSDPGIIQRTVREMLKLYH